MKNVNFKKCRMSYGILLLKTKDQIKENLPFSKDLVDFLEHRLPTMLHCLLLLEPTYFYRKRFLFKVEFGFILKLANLNCTVLFVISSNVKKKTTKISLTEVVAECDISKTSCCMLNSSVKYYKVLSHIYK